jgi:RimJ/RimL family protein N-acetyltransferase
MMNPSSEASVAFHTEPHTGSVRKLWSGEWDSFRRHLLRLDPESRRLRFAAAVGDAFLEDYARRMADMGSVVFAYVEHGEVRAAAELRKLSDQWTPEAEAAFSVEKPLQDQGLGTELMGRVILAARNRGVHHLYMSCMVENRKMQAIARKHAATLRFEYGDVIGDIVPQGPDYLSLWEEAIDDRVGYMLAVLDLGQRMVDAA